jgi:copper chaperone
MTRTYQVPDISCGHCRDSIESTLTEVDGVTRVEVDIDSREVHVEGSVDDETVVGALDEIGYAVQR